MSWDKGRDVIEDLLHRGHLEQVPGNEVEAEHLMAKARAHLRTAVAVANDDPEIAYDALYAAARTALTALLVQQGLRPTRAEGHEVTIEAATAQLVPPLGEILRPFRRLKRRRGKGITLGPRTRSTRMTSRMIFPQPRPSLMRSTRSSLGSPSSSPDADPISGAAPPRDQCIATHESPAWRPRS